MLPLNIEFQEEYKKLDKLLKDIFSSTEGVSSYIREMENTSCKYRSLPYNWEKTYKSLKRMRYLRNKLAHEVGTLDSDLCSEKDINWIKYFYKSVIETNDPLTVANKPVNNSIQERSNVRTPYNTKNRKISIIEKIKRWFYNLFN